MLLREICFLFGLQTSYLVIRFQIASQRIFIQGPKFFESLEQKDEVIVVILDFLVIRFQIVSKRKFLEIVLGPLEAKDEVVVIF